MLIRHEFRMHPSNRGKLQLTDVLMHVPPNDWVWMVEPDGIGTYWTVEVPNATEKGLEAFRALQVAFPEPAKRRATNGE